MAIRSVAIGRTPVVRRCVSISPQHSRGRFGMNPVRRKCRRENALFENVSTDPIWTSDRRAARCAIRADGSRLRLRAKAMHDVVLLAPQPRHGRHVQPLVLRRLKLHDALQFSGRPRLRSCLSAPTHSIERSHGRSAARVGMGDFAGRCRFGFCRIFRSSVPASQIVRLPQ